MKHIKLFEDFDLDKFLDNPGKEMADDNSPEISIGNYIDSYRGKGRVIDIDDDFATVELNNSKGNTVKVPVFALKKISSEEMENTQVGDSAGELASLVKQAQEYYDYLQNEADYLEDESDLVNKVNFESLLTFIQDTVVEVISIKNNDTAYDQYDDYHRLINLIASLADVIQTLRPDMADEIDAALDSFPS